MILGSVNEGTLPSSAMVSIGDVVNSESPQIHRQLAGGLTVANQLHGSANPIGGQNAIIKLRLGQGPEGLKFKAAPPGIKFALGENVKQSNWGNDKNTRFPQTRMGVPAFHENRFTAAWQYNREWRRFREKGGPPPRRDLELETIGQIIQAKRWIHCHSYRQDEILAFMRTMEKFGVRVGTLQHVLEGYKVADEIAAHGAGGSCFADWWAYKYEVIDAIPFAGSLMHERGVVVSFNSDSSDLARRLNLEAAKAVKYGNTRETEALNFVTINPAKQLRVDHRVGSLEVGKDGDFVIWSKHPLSTGTVCLETWIDGKRYFERSEGIARAEARSKEREKLLAKAKSKTKKDKKKEDDKDSKEARAAFFRRALETAHGLGVVDCQDCKIETE
jgi:N-acetylglucosamine-6-phosphate deacetylase